MFFLAAEQTVNNNYTVLYAPPELVSCQGAPATAQPGVAHDIWALGVLFQQLIAATCQDSPWFLPDVADVGAIQDAEQRADALHSAVAQQHSAWVRYMFEAGNATSSSIAYSLHGLFASMYSSISVLPITTTVKK